MRLVRLAVEVLLTSRGGICKLRPLEEKVDLRGVMGLRTAYRSSLDVVEFSMNAGDGDNFDLASWDVHGLGIGATERAFRHSALLINSVCSIWSTSTSQELGYSCCSWAVS